MYEIVGNETRSRRAAVSGILSTVRAWIVSALVTVTLAGCGGEAFACSDDAQCIESGEAGICHPPGFCGFPDDACESDYRFGAHAGDGLAGQCVPTPADGTSSAGTDTAAGTATSSVSTTVGTESTNDTTTVTTDPSAGSTSSPVGDTGSTSEGGTTGTTGATGTTTTAGTGEASTGGATDPDLVLWYRFDDPLADGPADSTDSQLHGTCDDCPSTVMGVDGTAAAFDGDNDWIAVPQSELLDLTAELTVSLWVRHDAWPGGFHTIAGRPYGGGIYNSWEISTRTYTEGSFVRLSMVNASGDPLIQDEPIEPLVDTWVHYALVWDGAIARIYVGGMQHVEQAVPSIGYEQHPIRIGSDFDNAVVTNNFPGALDDFRIYARALGADEIAALATR